MKFGISSRLGSTLLFVGLMGLNVAAVSADLQVGVGQRVITPDPLLPISGGVGIPRPAEKKLGDLTARAVALKDGETTVVLVSLDLLGFPRVLCDRVRALVPNVVADNILISSTHTHSAPDTYAFPDGKGGHTADLKYIDFVCRQAAAAINDAVKDIRFAHLKIGTGETTRRIAYNFYAPDLYDRRMSVIQALQPDGKVITTLVNFAIHPEVLGNGTGALSPDLVGPLNDRLEKQYGGMAIFINGALGGMITADNRDLDRPSDPRRGYWHDLRIWDECLRIGHNMAAEATEILQEAPLQENAKLAVQHRHIKLPVESDVIWAVVENSPLNYPRGKDRTVMTQISLITLGNAQLLTIPGEAMPNIGFYLTRKMKGDHNLLLGLTHDAFGYILTEVDFNSFKRYDYVSQTSLGEQTGEILMDGWLELLNASDQP